MASDIFNALKKRDLPNGHLLVEGCQFESKERVMEADSRSGEATAIRIAQREDYQDSEGRWLGMS